MPRSAWPSPPFFPTITLHSSYGYVGPALSGLSRLQCRLGREAAQLAFTVFDAGNLSAQLEQAIAKIL